MVALKYCPTESVVADMIAKLLGPIKLLKFVGDFGLVPVKASELRPKGVLRKTLAGYRALPHHLFIFKK